MTTKTAEPDTEKGQHDHVYRFVTEAAIEGDLSAVDVLMRYPDSGTAWVVVILFKCDSWSVRVHAAELVRDFATGTELMPGELSPLLSCLGKLDRAAEVENARLNRVEREALRLQDPDRDLELNDVPGELTGWFATMADEIEADQQKF